MRRFPALAPLALAGVLAAPMLHADEIGTAADRPLFPAAALRDALRGDAFDHRAITRDGEAALAYAEGYVAALAGQAERAGFWCGGTLILPHEVTARVFDHIEGLGDAATEIPADTAVLNALHNLAPCPQTTEQDEDPT
ncbi:hypothetical protein ACMA5I_04615 [Paracoccaceae bacterium GXU_MW_L88]